MQSGRESAEAATHYVFPDVTWVVPVNQRVIEYAIVCPPGPQRPDGSASPLHVSLKIVEFSVPILFSTFSTAACGAVPK